MNDISTNLFENIRLGKFKIIISKNQSVSPQLYLDDVLRDMFNAQNITSPEELYEHWKSFVKEDYVKCITDIFQIKLFGQTYGD